MFRNNPCSRRVLITTLTFIISACGSTSNIKYQTNESFPPRFEVDDVRHSVSTDNTSYFVTTGKITSFGDSSITPSPISMVTQWANQHLSSTAESKRITLEQFSVEILEAGISPINQEAVDAAVSSTPGADPLTGALATALIQGLKQMSNKKKVDVLIAVNIGGTEYTGFGQHSSNSYISARFIENTINEAFQDLAGEIAESHPTYLLTKGESNL